MGAPRSRPSSPHRRHTGRQSGGEMTRFTDAMWAEIRPTYEAILDLPFNRELAAGTLSRERFVCYMVQDAHSLGAFASARHGGRQSHHARGPGQVREERP